MIAVGCVCCMQAWVVSPSRCHKADVVLQIPFIVLRHVFGVRAESRGLAIAAATPPRDTGRKVQGQVHD